jgi:hypothetical protein
MVMTQKREICITLFEKNKYYLELIFDLLNSSYFDNYELKESVFVQCMHRNSVKLFVEKTKFKLMKIFLSSLI